MLCLAVLEGRTSPFCLKILEKFAKSQPALIHSQRWLRFSNEKKGRGTDLEQAAERDEQARAREQSVLTMPRELCAACMRREAAAAASGGERVSVRSRGGGRRG